MSNPFEELHHQIARLEGLVSQLLARPVAVEKKSEHPIPVEAAAKLLLVSTSAIYQNIASIPHHKRHGKLYFFESELLSYIKSKPEREIKSLKQPRPAKRVKAS